MEGRCPPGSLTVMQGRKTSSSEEQFECQKCSTLLASCPHGFGTSVACDSTVTSKTVIDCIACVRGKNYSSVNAIQQCQTCVSATCLENEKVGGECNEEEDTTTCTGSCKNNFFMNVNKSRCLPCSSCRSGHHNVIIKKCAADGLPKNMQCGPHSSFPRNEPTSYGKGYTIIGYPPLFGSLVAGMLVLLLVLVIGILIIWKKLSHHYRAVVSNPDDVEQTGLTCCVVMSALDPQEETCNTGNDTSSYTLAEFNGVQMVTPALDPQEETCNISNDTTSSFNNSHETTSELNGVDNSTVDICGSDETHAPLETEDRAVPSSDGTPTPLETEDHDSTVDICGSDGGTPAPLETEDRVPICSSDGTRTPLETEAHECKMRKHKISEMNVGTHQKFCQLMDKDLVSGNNYNTLGGHLDYTKSQMDAFGKNKPTKAMLDDLETKEYTVLALAIIVKNMGRSDALEVLKKDLELQRKRCNCGSCQEIISTLRCE